MADFQLTWNGPKMLREVRRITNDRLKAVAEIQISDTQAAVSHQCDFVNHSIPPNGPYRETGELHDSFEYKVDRKNLEVKVWNNAVHALPLELGWQPRGNSAFVPARPYQRKTLYKNFPRYAAILGAKMF